MSKQRHGAGEDFLPGLIQRARRESLEPAGYSEFEMDVVQIWALELIRVAVEMSKESQRHRAKGNALRVECVEAALSVANWAWGEYARTHDLA